MKGHYVKREDQPYRILMYCGIEHYFALIKKENFIVPFLKIIH